MFRIHTEDFDKEACILSVKERERSQQQDVVSEMQNI